MNDHPRSTWNELAPPAQPNRRTVLKGVAAGGSLLASFGQAQAQDANRELTEYKRSFFTDAEWAFVMAACARVIPSGGEGPGALEAHVPIFIDRDLSGDFGKAADWYMEGPHDPTAPPTLGFQSPLPPAQIYRQAIAAIDKWCHQQKGKSFAELDPSAQDDVLKQVEGDKVGLQPELRNFFSLLLQNTKEGYFSDPIYGGNHKMAAWLHIGYPGARGNFLEWTGRDNVRYPLGPVSISGDRA